MPDDITLTIDTSEWENLLKALPTRVAKRAAREALQAGGDVLRDAMEAEAPERTDTPTPDSNALLPGVLKESITTQVVIGTKSNPIVKVGPPSETVHVAWFIEQGFDHYTGGRKDDGRKHKPDTKPFGKKGEHIDANPFMVRAFDSSIERAVDATLASLATSLDQDKGGDWRDDAEAGGYGADDLKAANS